LWLPVQVSAGKTFTLDHEKLHFSYLDFFLKLEGEYYE